MSSQNLTDTAIIDLYFARDEHAIRETDGKYGKLCMSVSMNILHSTPDAEECVNDTYLHTWNAIPPTKPTSLCAFVCRIVRNLSLNRLRDVRAAKRNRELTRSLEELEACVSLPDEASDDLPALLDAFLRGLEPIDRALFMGRYWFSHPVGELAARLDITPNAASLRLYKTRERLRVYLTERGYRI